MSPTTSDYQRLIVVDVPRHFTGVLEIDPVQRRARVQPGVVRNELDLALVSHGLFFAPETSTQISKGLLRNAQRLAIRNVELLKNVVSSESPVVGIEPTGILVFRDEVPGLVPERLVEAANAVAKHALLIDEFIAREADRGRIR